MARMAAPTNTTAATRSDQSDPNSWYTISAGRPPTIAPITLTSARREFAFTSSASSRTKAGTSALFATCAPLPSTSTPNASGYTMSPAGAGLLMYCAIPRQRSARPAAARIISIRRPPLERSRAGPRMGATIANGAMVSSRKRKIFPRAALVGLWKKIDPASDTVRHASPQTPTACA
jgi:hypothetical protein